MSQARILPAKIRHLAIIMDGNGRWAEVRGLPRIEGHRAGVESVRDIATACAELGVERLTLYAFSSENWKRPRAEVTVLMRLLREFLVSERSTIKENDIRLTAIGDLDRLPRRVRAELEEGIRDSAGHRGTTLCLALSYGGRQEIVAAVRRLAREVAAGRLAPEGIDEAAIAGNLYDPDAPDPDLVIRTAGEMRISNFLLWQISYAEIYVTDVLWPDFRRSHLQEALAAYAGRVRRFGGLVV